jgi:hypothetical protein
MLIYVIFGWLSETCRQAFTKTRLSADWVLLRAVRNPSLPSRVRWLGRGQNNLMEEFRS